jgi:hypothetical protein
MSKKMKKKLSPNLLPLHERKILLRQASEWGMRALQGTFSRLKSRLTSDAEREDFFAPQFQNGNCRIKPNRYRITNSTLILTRTIEFRGTFSGHYLFCYFHESACNGACKPERSALGFTPTSMRRFVPPCASFLKHVYFLFLLLLFQN